MANSDESACCVRWSEHESLIQKVCYGLLSSERFTDVTLYCEGVSFKCHKFILSACSTYFDRIFSEMPTCDHPVIVLRDTPHQMMEALLEFIYKGEMTVPESKLDSLMKLGHSLHIKGISTFQNIAEASRKLAGTGRANAPVADSPYIEFHDVSEFNPKVTEVYSFQSEVADDPSQGQEPEQLEDEHEEEPEEDDDDDDEDYTDKKILPNSRPKRMKRKVPREADDLSSDTSTSVVSGYKRYSEQNLANAIKAVAEKGFRLGQACLKYGIPHSTLSYKVARYKEEHGIVNAKRRESSQRSTLSTPHYDETDEADGMDDVELQLEDDGEAEEMMTEDSVSATNASASFRTYRAYSEENLREALLAIMKGEMRIGDASFHYGIPHRTLSRKIRDAKQDQKR